MRRLLLMAVLFASSGCSLLPSRQPAKADFDFGPLTTQGSYAADFSEADIVVHEIKAPPFMDNSSMYYRLAYRNAANPMSYAQSEWVMSPAALLTQRLRARLAPAGGGEVRRVGVHAPALYALRSELVEFDQIFDDPSRSRGVLRLRATLEGDGVWMQRSFAVEKAAPTADAAGGVSALTQCSDELASLISEWVVVSRSRSREAASARREP